MKKMDKKGFTLIELLAVIVILAIIMVIAVPQILNVIESSRKSAWDSNVKLIDEAITLNKTLAETPFADFSLSSKCSAENFTTEIANIADISADDTVVTCSSATADGKTTYTVTVTPKAGGQFANVPKGSNNPAVLTY